MMKNHGMICLTFDDHDLAGWQTAIPLFEEFNAHALFSFSGEISPEAVVCMKALAAAGHTIGLHTVHHADAPEYIAAHGAKAYWDGEIEPQLAVCRAEGIAVKSFAFPNNKFNDEALALLAPLFTRFRAGCGGKGADAAFLTRSELPKTRVMRGIGLGEYYHTQVADVLAAIDRAADTDTCLTFFSHGIAPGAKHVNMPTELLTAILEHGRERGCEFVGFDDLPPVE